MPPSDPSPPRPGETAAGIGAPNGSFTGDRRDTPAPREFIPAIARGMSGLLPAAEQRKENLDREDLLESLGNFFPGAAPMENEASADQDSPNALSTELTSLFTAIGSSAIPHRPPAPQKMPAEATASLQSLASALLIDPLPSTPPAGISSPSDAAPRPPGESAVRTSPSLQETTRAAQFSLADLAGRLSSKLNTSPKNTAIDLLGEDSTEDENATDSASPGLMADWDSLIAPASPQPPVVKSDSALPDQSPHGDADWNHLLATSLSASVPPPNAVETVVAGKGGDAVPVPAKLPPRPLPLPSRPGGDTKAVPVKTVSAASSFNELPEAPVEDDRSTDMDNGEAQLSGPAIARPNLVSSAQVSQTLPPPMPPVPPAAEPVSSSGVLILMLGGTALALLGMVLACTLPILWLSVKELDEWSRHVTWAAIIVRGALAGGLMALGMGSLLQKRWSAPLIHASGWVGTLVASIGIAGIAWHWAAAVGGEQETMFSSPLMAADFMLLVPSLAISLILILLYQRSELQEICRLEDQSRRWTDTLPVPGLMVFISGLVILTGGLAMLAFEAAFPLPGIRHLTAPSAVILWFLLALLGATTAFLTFKHHRSALWSLSASTLALLAGPALAGLFGGQAWSDFITGLGKSGISPADSIPPLLAGLLPFPFILVLAMARRAFSSSPHSDVL